ncbi:hypothetical protein M569_01324, partial [Genlisea aurea]
ISMAFLLLLLLLQIRRIGCGDLREDEQALLDFIHTFPHSRKLNWDESSAAAVCTNWTGITCNHDNSRVIAVRLPGIGLVGTFPPNTLNRISSLQILSLRSNSLTGPFPADLSELRNLTGVYLQDNNFAGPLPEQFPPWDNLLALNLSDNHFNGSIPSSISNLTHLTVLDLAKNELSGDIPGDLNIPTLQLLDLSENRLTGLVPPSLLRFPASAFSGNNVTVENFSSPPPPVTHSRISLPAILGIVVGSSVLGFIVIAFLLVYAHGRKDNTTAGGPSKEKKSTVSEPRDRTNQRLTFLDGEGNPEFDLEDLLRASAEVLGRGTFGMTYKAALGDANVVVAVKRLTDVGSVGKKEFDKQMEMVGRIRHENAVPLRAYYFSKDEKLIVYDYYPLGSVSAMLHVKGSETLDWETRLKIAIGAARGLAHIHSHKLVHGNIKASNVFLNSQGYGCISDIGLAALISSTRMTRRQSGYRAPEVTDSKKASQASDVYSLGVFILELLTGKSPVHVSGAEDDVMVHLVRWVQSVVREEWTGEVFDVELLKYPNIEEDLVATLQIGLNCVAVGRPSMGQVVRMLEELKTTQSG